PRSPRSRAPRRARSSSDASGRRTPAVSWTPFRRSRERWSWCRFTRTAALAPPSCGWPPSAGSRGSSKPARRPRASPLPELAPDRTGSPSSREATTSWESSLGSRGTQTSRTSRTQESHLPRPRPLVPLRTGGTPGDARGPRRPVRLGTPPRPAQRPLRDGGLASPVPSGPRRGPVPGADLHDPLPANARREHGRRERAPLRSVPGRALARPSEALRGRVAHPGDRLLSREGAGPREGRERGPRALRRYRAPDLRGAHLPSGRRSQDRELRPGLRVRDPGDPGRHPRASHRQPSRRRAHPNARGDLSEAPRAGGPALLDPRQPAARPARPEPVPAEPPALFGVSDRRPMRDRSRSQRRSQPSTTGGPTGAAGVAGSPTSATKVASITSGRTSHATA